MSRRKESQGTYEEGLVFTQDELPPGYEPIGPLNDSNKPLHSFINRECRANRIKRYRIKNGTTGYGRLFVHKDDIARLTKEWVEPEDRDSTEEPATNLQYESAVIALCEINNGITLIQATLERLTLAVESMATQRKTAHDRLLATVESNGFHN